MNLPPEYAKQHISTKIWRAFFNYIQSYYDKRIFYDACREVGVDPVFLLDDDNWVSNKFAHDFISVLILRTGEKDLAKNVGRETLSSENINSFETTLLKSLGVMVFLIGFPSHAKKVNVFFKWVIRSLSFGKAVVAAIPQVGEKPSPFVCENTIGMFEAFKPFFKLDSLIISHNKCIHKGADSCEYELTYSIKTKIIKNLAFFIAIFLAMASAYMSRTDQIGLSGQALKIVLLLSATTIVACTFFIMYFRKYSSLVQYSSHYHEQSLKKTMALSAALTKSERRFREHTLLRELGVRLVQSNQPADVLKKCLDSIHEMFKYSRSMVMLISPKRNVLYVEEVRGTNSSESLLHLELEYPPSKTDPLIFANILANGKTVLIDNIYELSSRLKPKNRELINKMSVSSLVLSPIQDNDYKYGLLIIGTAEDEEKLTEDDSMLIDNITKQLSLLFRNAKMYENESTLRTVFERYVPGTVLEELGDLRGKTDGILQPQNIEITSMFIDIRDFTSVAEALPPEKVFNMIGAFNQFCMNYISEEGGIIDNIIGDAIVAFFSPVKNGHARHAQRGVNAAIKIISNWGDFIETCNQKGFPAIRVGIGLNSGPATVGSIGSSHRYNYTAMGDTVNVAARLQDLTRESLLRSTDAKVCLCLSEECIMRSGYTFSDLNKSSARLKGRTTPVEYFSIDIQSLDKLISKNKMDESGSRKAV